jgi:hypothetical protein
MLLLSNNSLALCKAPMRIKVEVEILHARLNRSTRHAIRSRHSRRESGLRTIRLFGHMPNRHRT